MRYVSSTTTFWVTVFEFKRTVTRDEGRLTRQFFRVAEKTSSTCADDVFREDMAFENLRMSREKMARHRERVPHLENKRKVLYVFVDVPKLTLLQEPQEPRLHSFDSLC